MSATEDETHSLDAGWDDAAPSQPDASEPREDEIDDAWDSLPPPASAVQAAAASPLATDEVDDGWDDLPSLPGQPARGGKRRPHRPRRVASGTVEVTTSAPLLPRPAEPTKKHQRDLARKQRAHAAQVREQRKAEAKAQRAAEARERAAARLREAEEEARARREREEARERSRAEKRREAPVAKPVKAAPRPSPQERPGVKAARATGEASRAATRESPKAKWRPGVVITLALLAVLVLILVLQK